MNETETATGRKRVLVVDDDPVLRALLQMTLRKAGYDVATANHGGQAVTLVGSGQAFDLILLDLMMPVMDGLRLLQWLRDESPTPALALVFSSFEGKTMSQRALEAGAADYLTKPVQIDKLLDRVQKLLAA